MTEITLLPATPALSKPISYEGIVLPRVIENAGERAAKRFLEFFTAKIRNPNTRRAYANAIADFLTWCEGRGVALDQVEPILVAAYIEMLSQERSAPTVKQHLAAIRMRGILPIPPKRHISTNPEPAWKTLHSRKGRSHGCLRGCLKILRLSGKPLPAWIGAPVEHGPRKRTLWA